MYLFELATISKFKKDYFSRKLYEEKQHFEVRKSQRLCDHYVSK